MTTQLQLLNILLCGNILLEWLLKRCVGVRWFYVPTGSVHWRVIAIAVLNSRAPAHKVGFVGGTERAVMRRVTPDGPQLVVARLSWRGKLGAL